MKPSRSTLLTDVSILVTAPVIWLPMLLMALVRADWAACRMPMTPMSTTGMSAQAGTEPNITAPMTMPALVERSCFFHMASPHLAGQGVAGRSRRLSVDVESAAAGILSGSDTADRRPTPAEAEPWAHGPATEATKA